MDYHTVKSLLSLHSYLEWFENQPKDARVAIQKDMKEFLEGIPGPLLERFYENIETNGSTKSTRAPLRRRRRPGARQ